MTIKVNISTWVNGDCTLGRLDYGDFRCFTLELPWRDNEINVSCIPEGEYDAIKYDSPSKGDVILLKGVKGRSFIEIHAGNFTRQIRGCILPGDGIKYLDADSIPDVTNSRVTLSKLLSVLPEEFKVIIKRTA